MIETSRQSAARFFWLLVVVAGLACSTPQTSTLPEDSTADKAQTESSDTSLSQVLIQRGEVALARGGNEEARNRFQRALQAAPHSAGAHAGLGKVAYAEGDDTAAIPLFRKAIELDPELADARLGLVRCLRRQGDKKAARAELEKAFALNLRTPALQQEFAEVSGAAPRRLIKNAKEAIQLARDYPFDPWAVVTAGEVASVSGQPQIAVNYFESALWLAMANPQFGEIAFNKLQGLSEEWRKRRLVPVHIWADETIRADSAWKFRAIHLFRNLSHDSDAMVKTIFLPISSQGFESGNGFPTLSNIEQRFRESTPGVPGYGIVIILTERVPPKIPGESWRLGQAQFLGRVMTVRLKPGELRSRVLVHELLHLYGGIHISPEAESIMNPSGDSYKLDPINASIFSNMRNRQFTSQGIQQNIFPWIDLREAAKNYERGLRLNLGFRNAGMIEARNDLTESPFVAAQRAQKAQQLDEHLISISKFLADIYLVQGKKAKAIETLRLTQQLQGPNSSAGQKTQAHIQRIESNLKR